MAVAGGPAAAAAAKALSDSGSAVSSKGGAAQLVSVKRKQSDVGVAPVAKKAKGVVSSKDDADDVVFNPSEWLVPLASHLETAAERLAEIEKHYLKTITVDVRKLPEKGLEDGQMRDIDKKWVGKLMVSYRTNPYAPQLPLVIHANIRKYLSTVFFFLK